MKLANLIVAQIAFLIHSTSCQINQQVPIDEVDVANSGNVAVYTDISSFPANNSGDGDTSAPIAFASKFLKRSLAPPNATIESFIWGGPGCSGPQGLYAEFDDKSGAFSYYTPRFSVLSGSKTPMPTDSRKQCTVNFKLSYPKTWQYSLGGAESKGYAGFNVGSALVQGSYYFSGKPGTEKWTTTLQGPHHEEWMVGYKPNEDQGVWSTCDQNSMLSIQTSVYLPPSTDPGIVLLEWTNIYLRWRECSKG